MDKVFHVEDYCIYCILEGVTEYKSKKYHFLTTDFENYNLILINEYIYDLILLNHEYYIELNNHPDIPCMEDYILDREENSYEVLLEEDWYSRKPFLEKTEKAYLNHKIIYRYLEENAPEHILKGTFFLDNIKYHEKYYNKEKLPKEFPEDLNKYNVTVQWKV